MYTIVVHAKDSDIVPTLYGWQPLGAENEFPIGLITQPTRAAMETQAERVVPAVFRNRYSLVQVE